MRHAHEAGFCNGCTNPRHHKAERNRRNHLQNFLQALQEAVLRQTSVRVDDRIAPLIAELFEFFLVHMQENRVVAASSLAHLLGRAVHPAILVAQVVVQLTLIWVKRMDRQRNPVVAGPHH